MRDAKSLQFLFSVHQPIINCKNLTKELGALAYNWKDKISNTGILKFCSKAAQEPRTQNTVFENEDSDHEKTAASVKGTWDDCEQGDSSPTSKVADKIISSGSAKKRTSSSGLNSPKRRKALVGIKDKVSTPNNQKTISDFFKK